MNESNVGDHITGNVGENSKHVIIGKNIIQIGSIKLPTWLTILIACTLLSIVVLVLKPLDQPNVIVEPLKNIDIRAFTPVTDGYEEMITSNAVVILPVTYINNKQPAKNAFIQHQQVKFNLATVSYEFTWMYFVNLHPEAGCWICSNESISTQTILSGQSLTKEVLFYCNCGPSWRDLIAQIVDSTTEKATFALTSQINDKNTTVECTVDMSYWRSKIIEFINKNDMQLPSRITMTCI